MDARDLYLIGDGCGEEVKLGTVGSCWQQRREPNHIATRPGLSPHGPSSDLITNLLSASVKTAKHNLSRNFCRPRRHPS